MTDNKLLDQFIQSFKKLDELIFLGSATVPPELDGGRDDSEWATQKWKPAAIFTDPSALNELYDKLPGRFPPLYEQLVVSYRWLEVRLGDVLRLLPNPPGPSLVSLMSEITADPMLVDFLLPQGLIQFGRAPNDYDPICFVTRRRGRDGETPVIRVEHEAILCNNRLGRCWELAPSFRSLVDSVIAKAKEL